VNTNTAPIKRVDHIIMRVSQVDEARRVMSLFADTLQLPVAWSPSPIYGGRSYAGQVWGGNIALQVSAILDRTGVGSGGIVLEPSSLVAALDELARRGITHANPGGHTVTDVNGQKQTYWNTAELDQLCSPSTQVGLCEYQPAVFRLPASGTPNAESMAQAGEMLQQELARRNGGPLGVQYVEEVVVGASDLAMSRRLWQKALDPWQMTADGVWQVGDGPALRVVPTSEDGMQAWVIKVRSLEQARDFLAERDLVAQDTEESVTLKIEGFSAFAIKLVE
jgi:hypothetical protein